MRTVLVVIGLLVASNSFMTIAWYGHLKYRDKPLLLAILVSWLIALPEYAFQVPANRFGYGTLSATQLKVVQEVVSVSVFVLFAWAYFGERPSWRTGLAFLLIAVAVALVRGENKPVATAPADGSATRPASVACPPGVVPPLPGIPPSSDA